MSWLRIDDGFTNHPKFNGWTAAERWDWLSILTYCARYKTQGRVPHDASLLPRFLSAPSNKQSQGATQLLAKAVTAGLLDNTPDGLQVHDWEDYNPRDPTAADRMRAYRERNANRNGDRNTDRNETVTRTRAGAPVTSRPLTTTPLSLRHGESELDEQENQEHARQRAWHERARQDDVRSPSAFARSGIASGGWPDAYQPAAADPRPVNMPPKDAAGRIAGLIRNGVIGDRFELDDEIQRAGLDPGEAGSLVAQFDLARQLGESEEEA